jgi:hypothetical protein
LDIFFSVKSPRASLFVLFFRFFTGFFVLFALFLELQLPFELNLLVFVFLTSSLLLLILQSLAPQDD